MGRPIAEALSDEARTRALKRYLKQLDLGIQQSQLDSEDRLVACREDRQGFELARKRSTGHAAGDRAAASGEPAAQTVKLPVA
jgi:hypothetical protein